MRSGPGYVHARRCLDCGGWVDKNDRHLPRHFQPMRIDVLHENGYALDLSPEPAP